MSFLGGSPLRIQQNHYALALALVAGVASAAWTAYYLMAWFGWLDVGRTTLVAVIYGVGTLVGTACALLLDTIFIRRWISNPRTRLIAVIAVATFMTIGVTAAMLILHNRIYFSQWHSPFLSRPWIWQQLWTTLGAMAQYAIFGIRYHGIGGFAIIVVTCWWATRTRH
ncbi:MAG: hypothetical protein AAFP99_08770 [Pseudomonadota bacterium]